MRVRMSNATVAHVAASSSPQTDAWLVRALIEKSMFNLLSFEKIDPLSQSLPIAGQGTTRPSIPAVCFHKVTLPSFSAGLAALILLPSFLSCASSTLLFDFSAAATAVFSMIRLFLSQSRSWVSFWANITSLYAGCMVSFVS